MNINGISKEDILNETFSINESFSDLNPIVDDKINQSMDISSPDSNYVSDGSMVCSEILREPSEDLNITIKTMDPCIDTYKYEELIDLSIITTIGQFWLYESHDSDLDGQSSVTFLASYFNSIIKDETNLLSLLTTCVSVSELSDTSIISIDLNASPHVAPFVLNATSTPIGPIKNISSLTSMNRTVNLDKFDHTDRAKLDTMVFLDRNLIKDVSPIKFSPDSSEESVNCHITDLTYIKIEVEEESAKIVSKVISRPVSNLHPQSRLSMGNVRILKQPMAVQEFRKPEVTNPVIDVHKTVSQPLRTRDNRQSVIARPSSRLLDSRLNRQSIAVLPQVKKDGPRTIVAPKSTLLRTFTLPSKIPPPETVSTNLVKRPPSAPVSKDAKANFSKDISPPGGIRRPSQLRARNNNALPAAPLPSDTTPVLSPVSNHEDNPLSRTFDRSDFILLKSVTNTEGPAHSAQSSVDSLNNNCTIYALAQAEEASLKGEAAPKSRPQKAVFRGLKPPSKIQSRAIPSLQNQ